MTVSYDLSTLTATYSGSVSSGNGTGTVKFSPPDEVYPLFSFSDNSTLVTALYPTSRSPPSFNLTNSVGAMAIASLGTAPISCRTLKVCAANLNFNGGTNPDVVAQALVPLGLEL